MIENALRTAIATVAILTAWGASPQTSSSYLRAQSGKGPAAITRAPSSSDATAPICLQVDIQSGLDTWQELRQVCYTDTYHAESVARNGETSVRMAISGTIERVHEDEFLITYDLEVRFSDDSGMTRFSAAGSGLFANGKSTRLVVMAGRSVIVTATLVEPDRESS